MRRVFLLVSLTVVAIVALAALASAKNANTTTTKFSVIDVQQSSRAIHNGFVTRGDLVQPGDRDDVLGHDVVKFKPRQSADRHNRYEIKAVAHLRDRGSLKVQGGVGPGDNKIPIVGGTDDFNGAAGKLLTHNLGKNTTRLTFVFVQ